MRVSGRASHVRPRRRRRADKTRSRGVACYASTPPIEFVDGQPGVCSVHTAARAARAAEMINGHGWPGAPPTWIVPRVCRAPADRCSWGGWATGCYECPRPGSRSEVAVRPCQPARRNRLLFIAVVRVPGPESSPSPSGGWTPTDAAPVTATHPLRPWSARRRPKTSRQPGLNRYSWWVQGCGLGE